MQSSLRETIERKRRAAAADAPDRFDGRGIVICAGGVRYFTCAWVLISVLRRHLGVTLPIQLWHLGQAEMSAEMRTLLVAEGVEVVDAETVLARHPARLSGGWPLKPYAILHSRFREVLYLDADTVPLVDPQRAFAWEDFQSNGLLLWPDAVDLKATSPVWAHLGLAPGTRVSIDSGILLADKARCWDILDLALAMNEHSEELYRLIHGDKDSFLLAALLLQKPFGLIPHRPFAFEWDMIQRDAAGDSFLHHRCGSKWLLNHPNRPVVDAALTPVCDAALGALRARWSGLVFHPPQRSARARAEEIRLAALRRFALQMPGSSRAVELLPDHVVGAGRDLARHWAVVDDAAALQLRFYRDHEIVASLHARDGGCWQGLGREPGQEIVLTPLQADVASGMPEARRVIRSAAEPLTALLQPEWFATGHDGSLAATIDGMLGLLNDAFDDVPEELSRLIDRSPPPPAWRRHLVALGGELAKRRDARLSLLRRVPAHKPDALDPDHYSRPAQRDAV